MEGAFILNNDCYITEGALKLTQNMMPYGGNIDTDAEDAAALKEH